jgi:hypothetical protein
LKIVATVLLTFVVLITAFLGSFFSMCAVRGDGTTAGNRGSYVLLDLIDIGIMVGAVVLIAKLNRAKDL